jgi:thiamine-monophosphate kinase
MARLSPEDALVRRISRAAPSFHNASVRLAGGDDAALWEPRRGFETVLTSDWFLEGSHLLRELHPPESVGWKCLARAASDVAAMGGVPRCFLLNLAIPPSHTGEWLEQFLVGLGRAARFLKCALAGGDTTRNERILINVTVIGEVEKSQAVLRSTAKPGDLLFVTGSLGEAELGLRLLRKGQAAKNKQAVRKHLYPKPRIALGRMIAANRLASAMMDVSDGLSTDLARLCAASGVGARIFAGRVPGPGGVPQAEARRLALHGGDDYELLFAVRPKRARLLNRSFSGIPITWIGEITRKKQLLVSASDGRVADLVPGGWDPFRK